MREEFRCGWATAQKLRKDVPVNPSWVPVRAALGVPLVVSEDVPEGKLQFWRDGELIKELDV